MADVQILAPGTSAAPLDYVIPGAQEILLKTLAASFDGTAAAVTWQPAVTVIAPSGKEVGTYPISGTLAAGASADVAWFPRGGIGIKTNTVPLLIQDIIVPLAGQRLIDFTGIPQTFRHLLLEVSLRTDAASIFAGAACSFNGIAGDYRYIDSQGTNAFSNTGGLTVCDCLGATADAQHFAYSTYSILDYATSRQDHGSMCYSGAIAQAASTAQWRAMVRFMQLCAGAPYAINQVTFDAGVGRLFIQNSRVTMYGLP